MPFRNSREILKNFLNYLENKYNNRIEDNEIFIEYNKMKVEEKKFSKMFIKCEMKCY